jgi:HK97 family phage portal protein
MNIIRKAFGWAAYKTVLSLKDPASWYLRNGYSRLAAAHADGRSYSGASVTQKSALTATAVFACTKIISEDVGSLPLFLYRRTDTGRVKAFAEPLYRVLHDAPNPETCAIDLRGAMTSHACLTGDGYARIVRRPEDNRAIGLYLLQPDTVRTDRDGRDRLVYIHKDGNAQEKTFGIRDVLHLRGFGWDGVHGFNAVRQFRESIGLGLAAEKYAAEFFATDATPSLVLKNSRTMGPEEVKNQKKAFLEALGCDKVAVTHSGIDIEKISFDPEQSQLDKTRIFQLLEVCRIFRMPPHKLAELSRATFSNIEQQAIEYYTQTLRPWLVRWEQAIVRCCLDPIDEADLYAEHAVEGMLRGDFKTQTEGFAKLLEKGVYSINEVRALLNLNPVEGGDEHFIQLNMQDIISAAAEGNIDQQIQQPKMQRGIFRVRELIA